MTIAIKETRVNQKINAAEVRLIDQQGTQLGIVSTANALEKAQASRLDLVEIAPNAKPPVCRIMDYGKYLFGLNKKRAQEKKKQKQIQIKEIKFRPGTDIGDYQIKLKKIKGFLAHGDKIKITLRFRGREMQHRELGMDVLRRVQSDLNDLIVIEQQPKAEGRQMGMIVAPTHKMKKKPETKNLNQQGEDHA